MDKVSVGLIVGIILLVICIGGMLYDYSQMLQKPTYEIVYTL